MPAKEVNIISLGCSKNLVDSERLMYMLGSAGVNVRHEPKSVSRNSIVVINTCGFINDAKEESINTILEWVEAKRCGKISRLYVMGCLSQRYADELPPEIPEVDRWFGKFAWQEICEEICSINPGAMPYDRILTTPGHHAYIKISEGCNRFCAFCAIPLITGRHKSRSIEEIADEIRRHVARGVKEFNIIAQDLSSYGLDLYGRHTLAELIDMVAQINGVKWIRLHYAYPSDFPMDLLDVMARHSNVCKYIDIALQHISDKVLTNMRRHITADETRKLLTTIREKVPGIHIRTTLMVGFPGEGDREFEELLQFVNEQRFERMGAFAYCEEDDTYAAKTLPDDIDAATKQSRLDRLMALQEEISLEIQQSKVGKRFNVVIDREDSDYYVGRTEFDSPEVDPEVLIAKDKKLKVGEFYTVEILEALPYELIAKTLED